MQVDAMQAMVIVQKMVVAVMGPLLDSLDTVLLSSVVMFEKGWVRVLLLECDRRCKCASSGRVRPQPWPCLVKP